MTPVDEAVERVRGYVESWDGFDDGTIISDNCDPNDLILSDLRALLSALELGRQAQQSPAGLGLHPSALQEPTADSGCVECINCNGSGHRDPHLGPEDPDNGECPLCGGDGMLYTLAALSASTTNSGRLDAEERLHAEAETVCEAVARAIREADASFCYSAKLTRLVDDIATYTLTIMGGPPVEITAEDACEQYTAAVDIARSKHRAAAVVAALNASQAHVKHKAEGDCEPPPAPPTGEGGES